MVPSYMGICMAKGEDCAFHCEETESAFALVCGKLSGKPHYGMVFGGISGDA